MHERSTIDCSECGTEVPDDVELCPQCGAEVGPPSEDPTAPADRSGEAGQALSSESAEPDRDERTDPQARAVRDGATDTGGGDTRSRLGLAVVFGVVGGMFLLAPVFLADLESLITPMLLLSGAAEPGMMPPTYGVGLFVATTLTMVGGAFCLLAAALRIAGIGFSVSKVSGTLGIFGGAIGIVMIFVV